MKKCLKYIMLVVVLLIPSMVLAEDWKPAADGIFYDMGNVGINTTELDRDFVVKYSTNEGAAEWIPVITVANTYISNGDMDDFSFASFEFSSNDGGVAGQFFADGSGYFLDGTPNVYFRSSTNHPILLGTNNTVRMILTNNGSVGIGTTNPAYKLEVDGSIGCKEINIINLDGADFVFKDGHELPDLYDVEKFIQTNKHLPDLPSENEIKADGINVGEMNIKLLQKIEELTLYVIELKKEIASFKE